MIRSRFFRLIAFLILAVVSGGALDPGSQDVVNQFLSQVEAGYSCPR